MMRRYTEQRELLRRFTKQRELLRRFTEQRELLRPTKTRFGTTLITLSHINEQKNNLKKMFTSSDWTESNWANEQKGKNITNIIFMSYFWNTIVFFLRCLASCMCTSFGE